VKKTSLPPFCRKSELQHLTWLYKAKSLSFFLSPSHYVSNFNFPPKSFSSSITNYSLSHFLSTALKTLNTQVYLCNQSIPRLKPKSPTSGQAIIIQSINWNKGKWLRIPNFISSQSLQIVFWLVKTSFCDLCSEWRALKQMREIVHVTSNIKYDSRWLFMLGFLGILTSFSQMYSICFMFLIWFFVLILISYSCLVIVDFRF